MEDKPSFYYFLKPTKTKIIISSIVTAIWWLFKWKVDVSECMLIDCTGFGESSCREFVFNILPRCGCWCSSSSKFIQDLFFVIIMPFLSVYIAYSSIKFLKHKK